VTGRQNLTEAGDRRFPKRLCEPSEAAKRPDLFQGLPVHSGGHDGEVRAEIESRYMPNWERASYLTKTYCEQAAWIFRGVSTEQIMEELLPTYYPNGPLEAVDKTEHAHDLALLFLIFAMGALVDLGQQSGNEEAEHYHQIARAAIYLQPVLEKPSIVTIQALHLLGLYNAMSGNELNAEDASMETTWSLVILAAHLSQTVRPYSLMVNFFILLIFSFTRSDFVSIYLIKRGRDDPNEDVAALDRDGVRWGLPDKLLQRRRILFWDLFVSDVWQVSDGTDSHSRFLSRCDLILC
jgi:hypothetical protein